MLTFAVIMWWCNSQIPLANWLSEPWNKLGWLIMILSLIPALVALRLFTRVNTTANPFNPEAADTLVTHGMYRYSRNPMYLSLFLLLTGWAVYLGSLVVLLFPPVFIWVIETQQIHYEELALEKLFGEEYLAYKLRVRRWL